MWGIMVETRMLTCFCGWSIKGPGLYLYVEIIESTEILYFFNAVGGKQTDRPADGKRSNQSDLL